MITAGQRRCSKSWKKMRHLKPPWDREKDSQCLDGADTHSAGDQLHRQGRGHRVAQSPAGSWEELGAG